MPSSNLKLTSAALIHCAECDLLSVKAESNHNVLFNIARRFRFVQRPFVLRYLRRRNGEMFKALCPACTQQESETWRCLGGADMRDMQSDTLATPTVTKPIQERPGLLSNEPRSYIVKTLMFPSVFVFRRQCAFIACSFTIGIHANATRDRARMNTCRTS